MKHGKCFEHDPWRTARHVGPAVGGFDLARQVVDIESNKHDMFLVTTNLLSSLDYQLDLFPSIPTMSFRSGFVLHFLLFLVFSFDIQRVHFSHGPRETCIYTQSALGY